MSTDLLEKQRKGGYIFTGQHGEPIFHRYHSVEYFAEGGMADVYTAYHKEPTLSGMEKQLAIKIIKPQYAERQYFVEAFEREAEVLLLLSHPNIVQVFEQLQEDGRYALVMEFIDTPDLSEFLHHKPNGKIPWEDKANPELVGCNVRLIAEQVLNALHYAHNYDRPVYHLDIKPANIKLDSANNRVKILDFGIAAMKESRDDLVTASAGTVDYMPPEQMKGYVDQRSDIYATAVLFYELLTGAIPWKEDNSREAILQRKTHRRFPSPHELDETIPKQVSDAIMFALQADPSQRPGDILIFKNMLFGNQSSVIHENNSYLGFVVFLIIIGIAGFLFVG